jgi:tRNA(adenine34) deaminase
VHQFGRNLEATTLYTNFEPCPMCSFLVRDFNVGRVVYCLPSPHWGGGDRWPILYSIIDERYNAAGEATVPDVYGGCLINEGEAFFDRIGWTMHKAPHHE